jgi:hypothetical protein
MTKPLPHVPSHNDKGLPICGRRRKRCPKPCNHQYTKAEYDLERCPDCGRSRWCENTVSKAGDACRSHGGESLKGIAHPNTVTGRYSKYLLPEMRERYEASLADPDQASMRDELAIIDDRIVRLIISIREKEAGPSFYIQLRQKWVALQRASRGGDPAAFQTAMDALDETIRTASAEAYLYEDIGRWVERRARIAERVDKHIMNQRQHVSFGEFSLFMLALQSILREEVGDRKALNRIADKIDTLLASADVPIMIEGNATET